MESISEQSFLDQCQTGDLLLYSTNYWYSKLIEWGSKSIYSHISMILRDPVFINKQLKGLYILESCKESIPDCVTGKKVYGVQIIPLEHILREYRNSYTGYLYYRKLSCQKDSEFYEKIKDCFIESEGKKYDLNPIDWFLAAIDSGDEQKTNTFFCSALMGFVYCKLGFLDKDISWTTLSPRKFSYYENSRLTYHNCNLDPEKYISF